jgi:protein-tyrosine-phosphatase
MVKKIIFICKYNVFRSKVAEAYFKKINQDKTITAVSRGFIMGGKADKIQKKVAKKFGVELKGNSKPVNLKELIEADKIIVVANDIPKIMFNYWLKPIQKKVIIWKIKDEQKMNKKNIEKIIKKIKDNIMKMFQASLWEKVTS